MVDIVLETIRAILVGVIIYALVFKNPNKYATTYKGWPFIIYGFTLVFVGMVVDITDNFPQLNKYIIIGDTPYQAFLEKFVGYLFGFIFLALGFWKWIPAIEEVEKSKRKIEKSHNQLQDALDEVQTLKGIFPICSFCKQIRDDKGFWKQVEVYIKDHSGADFSHSICPECAKKHYSDFLPKKK